MGRKSQSKQSAKKSVASVRENSKLLLQKRKELSLLVDHLLQLTSIFQTAVNLAKCWEHYLEIEQTLQQIVELESTIHSALEERNRKSCLEEFVKWLNEHKAHFEGIEICEFEGYEMGLKAAKNFSEGSLVLTIPRKLMMTDEHAKKSDLRTFILDDPLLQNMPNITLALFLLLERNNPDSFWKPYIDVLPDKYSTILYYTAEELSELKPSPVLEQSLKLYRSIARQYAYFYNKFQSPDSPAMKRLRDVFTYESYRWAVSTVMTRQNSTPHAPLDSTAFIPLWDMCNHEDGKITTDFDPELQVGECFALRDFKAGEQIFIFYGVRSNADLFLHNGFVYPANKQDSYSIALGVSLSDPLRELKVELLGRLGLASATHYTLYSSCTPISPELLAFVRIFNMNKDELLLWLSKGLPGDLVSSEPESAAAVGIELDRRAYKFLLTRCSLIRATYKQKDGVDQAIANGELSLHRKNVRLLKICELQILEHTTKYIEDLLTKLQPSEKLA